MHAHSRIDRLPISAIVAIGFAVLGLALPRFGGPIDPESVPVGSAAFCGTARIAEPVRGGWTGDSDGNLADDSAEFAAPVATAADAAGVLQRTTEAVELLSIELGCSKSRALLAHVRPDAKRCLVTGDPVRVAEREVAAQGRPLLRWRLAHSTSSAIG